MIWRLSIEYDTRNKKRKYALVTLAMDGRIFFRQLFTGDEPSIRASFVELMTLITRLNSERE